MPYRSIGRIMIGLGVGIIVAPIIVALAVALSSGFAEAAGMLIAIFFASFGLWILKMAGVLIVVGIVTLVITRQKK